MGFAEKIREDRIRDAKLVEELKRTARKYRTPQNIENYNHAINWFLKKHHISFEECFEAGR